MSDPSRDLLTCWQERYGDVLPRGHVLRKRFPARWVRFHSLPDAKRYADTDDERREILRRENELVTELVGEGRPYELIVSQRADEESPLEDVGAALRRAISRVWSRGSLDDLLLSVADDLSRGLLVISIERACVFAPYDGGVDIIVATEARRDELRERYPEWRSRHPAGL